MDVAHSLQGIGPTGFRHRGGHRTGGLSTERLAEDVGCIWASGRERQRLKATGISVPGRQGSLLAARHDSSARIERTDSHLYVPVRWDGRGTEFV